MYMAFVIPDEDRVSFHTKNSFGDKQIIDEYIQRDNVTKLNFFINKYMFQKKNLAEKKALRKRNSQKNDGK